MASGSTIHAPFATGIRALRLFGVAGLAVAAIAAGCGKVTSTDIAGADGADTASYTLSIQLAASSTPPGSQLGFTVSATDKDGNTAQDGTVLTLSADGLGSVSPTSVTLADGKATATFTAGSTEGTSTIKVKYDSRTTQTVTVTIDKAAETTTGTGSTTATGDEFPYGVENIQWDNRGTNMDVGSWDVNAEITSAYHKGEELRINNNCSDVWRHVQKEGWTKASVGNYWIIGKVNGEWHGATVDWVGINRNGMTDLHLDGKAGMYSDLTDWRPANGEEAYVMISTHARAYVDASNKHRTQIVRITINH